MSTSSENETEFALEHSDFNACKTPDDLFKSEKFAQFLRIYNEHGRKEASQSGHYGYKDLTVQEITTNVYFAKNAHEFLQELQVKGALSVTTRLAKLADQTLERIQKTDQAHSAAERALYESKEHLHQPFSL